MRHDSRRLPMLLAALVLANFLVDLAGVIYVDDCLPGSSVFDNSVMAILFSQVLLLGFWLALGETKWYWRIVVTVLATILVPTSVVAGSTEMLKYNAIDRRTLFGLVALMCLTLLIAVLVLVIPLRRLGKWRLTWQRVTDTSSVQQFRIRDLMLWMVPMGAVLAAVRLIATFDQTKGNGLIDLSLKCAGLATIEWAAMLTAFATRRRYLAVIFLVVFALLLGSIFAGATAYQTIRNIKSVATGAMPWQYYFRQVNSRLVAVLLSFVVAALAGLLNCLMLRLLGCQLVSGKAFLTCSPNGGWNK